MSVLVSTMEIPKQWTRERVMAMFPGATHVGSTYGWFHYIPETNVVIQDLGWMELVRLVTKHLHGNGIHVPADLNLCMMAEYCRLTNSPACAEDDPNQSERQAFWEDAQRFLRAMEDAVMNDGLVDQAEAERRGALCASCPQNQPEKFGVCFGCSARTAAAKLAKMTLGLSTSHDSKLLTCKNCHCKNALKIWCRREIMDEPRFRDGWEKDHCWMLG